MWPISFAHEQKAYDCALSIGTVDGHGYGGQQKVLSVMLLVNRDTQFEPH